MIYQLRLDTQRYILRSYTQRRRNQTPRGVGVRHLQEQELDNWRRSNYTPGEQRVYTPRGKQIIHLEEKGLDYQRRRDYTPVRVEGIRLLEEKGLYTWRLALIRYLEEQGLETYRGAVIRHLEQQRLDTQSNMKDVKSRRELKRSLKMPDIMIFIRLLKLNQPDSPWHFYIGRALFKYIFLNNL